MNIAYYSHYFVPEIGAPSARIYDLSQQWLKSGHQVEVVTCFPNHPAGVLYPGYEEAGRQSYQFEKIDGIDVHRNWTYLAANKGFIKKTMGHVSLWPTAWLYSERKLKRPDVIIGTSPTFFAAMGAVGAARRKRVPFVMEVRDLWPAVFVELGVLTNPLAIRLLERWEMWMYRQAKAVITVTEAFRQNLIERGIPAEKVHTIPNGADTDFWQARPKPAELEAELNLQGKFVALYIGAHGISQALSAILHSADLLRNRPDIVFLFVGAGAEKDMLKAKAAEMRLDNVIFHDPVPKERVGDFYALSDVCLVPLRNIPLFDTFIPSKMFEILAMEKPIVGSLSGEAADILRRSGGGRVVTPEASDEIAAAVAGLADQHDRLPEIGRSGREFVKAHYSRAGLAVKYAEILQTL